MVITKVAITQLAMELQLWKFTIQYIQKIGEQHIRQKSSIFNSFWVISDLLNGQMLNLYSYYSVSYGATPWTPHHDVVHEGVVEQHISGQYCK